MESHSNIPMLAINSKLIEFLFSYGRKRIIPAGETFISEGDDSNTCFVLLDGEADILKKDENGSDAVIVRISKGTIIGEMGVFLEEKRSSSVRAATPLILLEFTAARFFTAVNNIPELAIRIIKSLAEKLNAANQQTVTMR